MKNFSWKKALGKFLVGGIATLVALGVQAPDFFERVFMPEALGTAAGVGAIVETLDFLHSRLKEFFNV